MGDTLITKTPKVYDLEKQAEFELGDIVKITGVAEDCTDVWNNYWMKEMTQNVGKMGVVVNLYDDSGVYVKIAGSLSYSYPYWVLEKVDPTLPGMRQRFPRPTAESIGLPESIETVNHLLNAAVYKHACDTGIDWGREFEDKYTLDEFLAICCYAEPGYFSWIINRLCDTKPYEPNPDIEVGDYVMVMRVAHTEEQGWNNTWPDVYDMVDKVFQVLAKNPENGVLVDSSRRGLGLNYYLPEFVLVKVDTPKGEKL